MTRITSAFLKSTNDLSSHRDRTTLPEPQQLRSVIFGPGVHVYKSPGPEHLLEQIAFFIVQCRAADMGNGIGPVDNELLFDLFSVPSGCFSFTFDFDFTLKFCRAHP